jgi:hypothetical protein
LFFSDAKFRPAEAPTRTQPEKAADGGMPLCLRCDYDKEARHPPSPGVDGEPAHLPIHSRSPVVWHRGLRPDLQAPGLTSA